MLVIDRKYLLDMEEMLNLVGHRQLDVDCFAYILF